MNHAMHTLLERPAPLYGSILRDLELSDLTRRREGVERVLLARATVAKRASHRNRMWADAVALLAKGEAWSPSNESRLLDRRALLRHAELLESIKDRPTGLDSLTAEVLRGTWSSFDEFAASDEGHATFLDEEADDRIGRFQTWFERYLPYVMVGVPIQEADAQRVVASRIAWMLDKAFSEDQSPEGGLRDRFADDAWFYAQQRWNEASSEAASPRSGSQSVTAAL